MTTKDRLKQYIEEDKIYNNWVNNNLNELSDFDKFCIQHCNDIKEILEENQELKKQLKIKQDGFTSSIEDLCEYARENERLQKQLEIGKEQYNDLVEEKEKIQEELSSKILQLDNQQKEFIEWLEQNIENEEYCYLAQNPSERCRKDIFEEVLSKYKEIIGVKDE